MRGHRAGRGEPETGRVRRSQTAYGRPQPHACFIQSVEDEKRKGDQGQDVLVAVIGGVPEGVSAQLATGLPPVAMVEDRNAT